MDGVFFHTRDEFLCHYCTIVTTCYMCVMCVLGYIENEATTQRDGVIFRHTWIHVTCRKPSESSIFSAEKDTIADSDETCAFAGSGCGHEGAPNC
jgi:hypothetical protein